MRPARPGWLAPPRYATAGTGRPNYGTAIGKVSTALHRPPQPWQHLVNSVATELLPDSSWAYRTVVVHVQRQAGKTTLLGPKNVHRCIIKQGAKTWLTAQTRQDGRDTWRDVAELVGRSPLAELVTVRRSNGSEELGVAATGSSFRVFAPSEDALHGKANESVDVDEPWVFDAVQGIALEQAILPTFTTTGGQLWLVSTAGTASSVWLRRYVERGRAAVEAGQTTGLAYFEWSLDAEAAAFVLEVLTELHRTGQVEQASFDHAIDLVLAAHPGQYVRRDAVEQAAATMAPGEFLRAYGNVWTLTADRVIADHAWRACRDPQLPAPEPRAVSLAFAVPIDRSVASIGAAWDHGTRRAVDVVDERPGTRWLVERLEDLARRFHVPEVACDGAGPALDVADQLERRGVVKVRRLSTVEYATGCAAYLDAVDTAQLVHRGTAELDQAAANAAKRELGDRWVWSRRHSAGSIAGLEATTVASFVHDHGAPPMPEPELTLGPSELRPELLDRVATESRRRSLIL